MKHRRIASNLLLHRGKFLRNPLVEVDAEGVIRSVTSYDPTQIDRLEATEHYAGVMCAGFVNAHCHLELSYLRNKIAEGGGFATFASQIGRVRTLASDQERLEAIKEADAELTAAGVVATGDIVNGTTSYATKSCSTIEYRNFAEIFGLNTHDTQSVEPLLSLPNTSLTQHSTYSLNDTIFRHVAGQATPNAPLSIHFMESEHEQLLFERQGSLHEWYERAGFECDFLHYGSPAQRIVSCIDASQPVILVHCCMVHQEDIDLIMSHFTAPVYWVVSPRSNHYISRLTPPIELLRRNSLNICVGTDSLASNHSLSILEELRMFPEVPLAERLDWATRQGAAALQMEHRGTIEVGKRPGINIISALDYPTMGISQQTHIQRII
ncbi:MAG: amidohydrolase family protein [Rikenellaceae bacterium]